MANSKPQPKSKEELQGIIAEAVRDAVDHIETDIAPARKKAQEYYDGKVDIGHEEGRSSVVATKVRDTIRQIKPSLMRIFLSHERPVEFVPTGPEDDVGAQQATAWCKVRFDKLGGFQMLQTVFDDALLKKTGYLKVFHEEQARTRIYTFTGLTEDELYLLASDSEVEVLEHSEVEQVETDPETGAQQLVTLHDLKIARTTRRGEVMIDTVPPEEFFISPDAKDNTNPPCCGQRTEKTAGDLIAMGFSWDEIEKLGSVAAGDTAEQEDEARRGHPTKRTEPKGDPALRKITLTEAYMAVDVDGTGIPVLHRFLLGGVSYKLLDWEPFDDVPYAAFQIDPIGHSAHGRSIMDLIKEDQDAGTSILRGILDNVTMVNNPRFAALEGMVNMADLMNGEIGGVVRERVAGAVRDLSVPFVAGQTLGALQYLDQQTETKTGVTKASSGLDPDAMQSTTKAAVSATISAAAAQVEVMAGNLARGGMTRLFQLMVRAMVRHATKAELIRINGQYVPVDPRIWNIEMDLMPNVGLGTGMQEERGLALDALIARMEMILGTYGLQNGLVTLTGYRNAIADRMALAGYRNLDRYIQPMDPTTEGQLLEAQAQAQQAQQGGASDPNAAYLQAEQMKAQAKIQTDMMKEQRAAAEGAQRLQLQQQQMLLQDDRERDRMVQDLELKTADMQLKYGVQMNTAAIKAEQAAPRIPGGGQ